MGKGSTNKWLCRCGEHNSVAHRSCTACGAEREGERGLRRLSASNSFTLEEVMCLDAILSAILRGGDARILARSDAGRSLMRKAITMRKSIESKKLGVELPALPATKVRSPSDDDPGDFEPLFVCEGDVWTDPANGATWRVVGPPSTNSKGIAEVPMSGPGPLRAMKLVEVDVLVSDWTLNKVIKKSEAEP